MSCPTNKQFLENNTACYRQNWSFMVELIDVEHHCCCTENIKPLDLFLTTSTHIHIFQFVIQKVTSCYSSIIQYILLPFILFCYKIGGELFLPSNHCLIFDYSVCNNIVDWFTLRMHGTMNWKWIFNWSATTENNQTINYA